MIKKIFLKTLTIKYLIFFTILNILYANDKDFRPQKNIFNKINDYYLKDSYNYYGTKKKVLLVDISDINKLIIGDKDLEEIFEIDDIPSELLPLLEAGASWEVSAFVSQIYLPSSSGSSYPVFFYFLNISTFLFQCFLYSVLHYNPYQSQFHNTHIYNFFLIISVPL